MATRDGAHGWDEYAPFYDWENARTVGRRDVPFWRGVAQQSPGPVLELGTGTGRILLPLLKADVPVIGVDRSAPMLARAATRVRRVHRQRGHRGGLPLVQGDMRHLPFADGSFATVLAPYGVLQSLTRERDLSDALASVARVLAPGGVFGVDLVPDVPQWQEYTNRTKLKGAAPGGVHLTLVESVRQDRARHLTTFAQTYIARRGLEVRRHAFDLTFRTLPIPAFVRRLERHGFALDAVLGDYRGGAWDERADVWVMLARRVLG